MILEKIKKIIAEQIDIEEESITEDTSFEALGVDSLDLFEIIISVEEAFDVQIEDAEAIKTVGDAVEFVEKNLKK